MPKTDITADLAEKLTKARRKAKRWKAHYDELLAEHMTTRVALRQANLDLTLARTERDQAMANCTELSESYDLVSGARQREADEWEQRRQEGDAQVRRLTQRNQELNAVANAHMDALRQVLAIIDQVAVESIPRPIQPSSLELVTEAATVRVVTLHAMVDDLAGELAATKSELSQMTTKRDDARRDADRQLSATQKLADVLLAHRAADDSVGRLATWITMHVPGEPSRSEGACDTAIRLLSQVWLPTAEEREPPPVEPITMPGEVASPSFIQQLAGGAPPDPSPVPKPPQGQSVPFGLPHRLVGKTARAAQLDARQEITGSPLPPNADPVQRLGVEVTGDKHCRGGSGRHTPHNWWDEHEPDAERWYCDGSTTYDLRPGQCGWDVLGFACTLDAGHAPDGPSGHVSTGSGGAWIDSQPEPSFDDATSELVAELATLIPEVDEELEEAGAPRLAEPWAPTHEGKIVPNFADTPVSVYKPQDEPQHDPAKTTDVADLTADIENGLTPRETLAIHLAAARPSLVDLLDAWDDDDPSASANEIIALILGPEVEGE